MKLVVFSICKDEAATIGEVLSKIPKKIKGIDTIEKLVISDGSTDETAAIARKNGARVIEGQNQKRLAYRFAQAMEEVLATQADIAVNIDGDLQFNPADIPLLVAPIIAGEADFVAADRFTDPKTGALRKPANMPTGKYWANKLGARMVGQLSGQRFHDVTCGFRAYSRKALLAINLNSEYTYTQESFQLLAAKKMTIKTVPLPVKYYPGRRSRVVTSFWSFLIDSGFTILRNYRDFQPLRFFSMLSAVNGLIGIVLLSFIALHWARTSALSPYKTIAFAGIYFITAALFLFVIGLLADMLARISRNQEKLIELTKKQLYDKNGSEKK